MQKLAQLATIFAKTADAIAKMKKSRICDITPSSLVTYGVDGSVSAVVVAPMTKQFDNFGAK